MRVRVGARPSARRRKIHVAPALRSDCCRVDGVCYLVGSAAAYVSIGTTLYATIDSPNNVGNLLTPGFLMVSYALKLGYYRDKRLAFLINATLGALWGVAFVNAVVWFSVSPER